MTKKFLDKKLDKLIRWLRFQQVVSRIPKESIVCDIGCGQDCLFLTNIENRLIKGIGIDQKVDNAIEQRNKKIRVHQADVQSHLPIETASVDAVSMMALLEHLEKPKEALEEIYRILKPGGRLILTTPAPIAKPLLEFMAFKLKIIDREAIEDHKQYFSVTTLKSVLRQVGFEKIKIKHFELGLNLLAVVVK
jgi:ubiquinone/menaquinone biosynthesis C-methylase UbiE